MANESSSFDIPADLNAIDPSKVVGQSRVEYKRRGVQLLTDGAQSEPAVAVATTAEPTRDLPPDTRYLITGLPSGCSLYGLAENGVHVRPFNNEDVLKIYDARAEESFRMLAEVLGATLSDISVWDLTIGDFWFLMYWHRIHSYPKSPFIVDWTCTHDDHFKLIRQDKASVDTLQQQMVLKSSDLQVKELDVAPLMRKVADIRQEFGVETTIMRMGDYCRLLEMDEENDAIIEQFQAQQQPGKGEVPKLRYKPSDFMLARHASNLSSVHGQSLEQRMTALKTLADFSLWPHLDQLVELSDHGVVETYNVVCKTCGSKTGVEVALDALTFLPQL